MGEALGDWLRAFCGRCGVGERWASALLSWGWRGALLVSEISVARYFVRCDRCETTAWAELRDPGGRRRVEIGSFSSVALAKAAAERDAQLRCRREREERGPVDVRIAPGGRGRSSAAVPAQIHKPRAGLTNLPHDQVAERSAVEALDDALRAFADAVADCD